MTREECLEYRRNCPYDAMGDYSVFIDKEEQGKENEGIELPRSDISDGEIK